MNNEQIIPILKACTLFKNAGDSVLSDVCQAARIKTYKSGEMLFGGDSDGRKIGIVTEGNASVFSTDKMQNMLLRTLSAGDTLGVCNLFTEKPFSSRVIANGVCKVLIIPEDAISEAIKADENVMFAYIDFLSGRVRFLNNMIVCLTAGCAERKLAVWLTTAADKSDTVLLANGSKSLSDMLNIGRASLYRAFDTLTEAGLIQKDGKNIKIANREKLLEFCYQEE